MNLYTPAMIACKCKLDFHVLPKYFFRSELTSLKSLAIPTQHLLSRAGRKRYGTRRCLITCTARAHVEPGYVGMHT